ncbi:hypothetical protein Hanom_Chr08g00730711 [Helianthus anomalus]
MNMAIISPPFIDDQPYHFEIRKLRNIPKRELEWLYNQMHHKHLSFTYSFSNTPTDETTIQRREPTSAGVRDVAGEPKATGGVPRT